MNTKRIIAITTITTLAAAGLANAQNSNQITGQTSSTSQTGPMHTFMQNLTDAQKTVLTQARALFKAGNSSAAETLLTQNGIKIGAGMHERNERGAMKGKGGESRKAINDAIIAGNFSVFQQVASTS